jgi:hypothetical protein
MEDVVRGLASAVALATLVLAAQTALAKDLLVFDYHGWHVDLTGARGAEPAPRMVAAVERQLDIVEQVALKPQVLDFMRTIRIWANPRNASFGPGRYGHATGIDLRVRALEAEKPIILHELLHAYHDRRLPGGLNNPDIEMFYQRGKTAGWPSDAYMLTNNREFFAVTASVYLFGDIPRPPESRKALRSKQPRYYQWLADLFDDGKPRE